MKKIIAITVLVAVVAAGAFAVPELKLSAGVNGDFLMLFNSFNMTPTGSTTKSTTSNSIIGGGGGVFFDATYAQVQVGIAFANNKQTKVNNVVPNPADKGMNVTWLTMGLLGKFPIAISDTFSIAPAAGIQYNIFLGGKDVESGTAIKGDDPMGSGSAKASEYFNAFIIKAGAQLAFDINDNFFIQGLVLCDLKLNSKPEADAVTEAKKAGKASNLTLGPSISIGVGYRF